MEVQIMFLTAAVLVVGIPLLACLAELEKRLREIKEAIEKTACPTCLQLRRELDAMAKLVLSLQDRIRELEAKPKDSSNG
jgi:hypothetical protein